jgi:hypothetical protein
VNPTTDSLLANTLLFSNLFSQTDIRNVANCLNDEGVAVDRSQVMRSKSGGIAAYNRKIFEEVAGGVDGPREDYSTSLNISPTK